MSDVKAKVLSIASVLIVGGIGFTSVINCFKMPVAAVTTLAIIVLLLKGGAVNER